jgi:hypothetical protein
VTVGEDSRTKCSAEGWDMSFSRGKKKKDWIETKTKSKPCEAKIIEEGNIPDTLDLFNEWEYKIMHAFLIGQKIDSEFMITIQSAFKKIWEELIRIREEKK